MIIGRFRSRKRHGLKGMHVPSKHSLQTDRITATEEPGCCSMQITLREVARKIDSLQQIEVVEFEH